MTPNIYELDKMTKEQYDIIMKRAEQDITEQMKIAKEVSDDIRDRGDAAGRLLFAGARGAKCPR